MFKDVMLFVVVNESRDQVSGDKARKQPEDTSFKTDVNSNISSTRNHIKSCFSCLSTAVKAKKHANQLVIGITIPFGNHLIHLQGFV